MLNTCFGCCPLRHGVSAIAILNIIWNIMEVFKHVYHRSNDYDKVYHKITAINEKNITDNVHENITYYSNNTFDDSDSWFDFEEIPLMSGMFMDYILVTILGWIVLELISNICLKQSTFKYAPHKIYVWLTIYYTNVLFMILHVTYVMMMMMWNPGAFNMYSYAYHTDDISHLISKLIYIVIVCIEIFIVHSHYIKEKNAMLNDFVQLKWKYVSNGEVVSRGVDYPSMSTFKEETSCQTQDGSKIPPYITKILQN